MTAISGKLFQMTDGATSPVNLFPYTVTDAVYGLSSVLQNLESDILSNISAVTLNGVSYVGQTASFYAPTTSGTTGQVLKAVTGGAPTWGSIGFGDLSTHPTTLGGYGITDANIASGVITLGGNTITPVTGVSAGTNTLNITIGGSTTSITVPYATTAGKLSTAGPLNIWGVQYWNNGIPNAVTGRPNLYIGQTQVQTSSANQEILGVTAISNAASSGSSDQSRIVWDSDHDAWHFLGNVYADGFVSAGGISSGGGASGTTLQAVWDSLTGNTGDYANVAINSAHIPDLSGTYLLKTGDRMSGILLMASSSVTVTGGATRIQTAEAVNDVVWPVALKNYYHTTGTSGVVGVGLKLSLGYLTEGGKWAGIAAMSESDNENSVGMRFYVGTNNSVSAKMSLSNDGSLSLSAGNLNLSAGNIFLNNGGTSGNRKFGIKKTNSSKNVDIGWDWDAGDGAGAYFQSTDDTSSGAFGFYARNSTSGQKTLSGYVDGRLTWDSKTIWHAGNSNTGYPWGCTTLTASGNITTTGNITFTNGGSSGNRIFGIARSESNKNVDVGWNWTNVDGSGAFFRSSDFSGQPGAFGFFARSTSSNTKQLVGKTDGTLTWDGTINGSSDIAKKKDLENISYTVQDIAKCRAVKFTWKADGIRSAGSIAQDWKPIIPELVNGDDGNLSLAYGNIALINTILLARHESEQDKKIEELEGRVRELEEENKLLKQNIQQ